MLALALAAIALQSAAPERPRDVPPPYSHVWMIGFDSGSAALSPTGQAMLDSFGTPDTRWGLTTRIEVVGHADTVGGDRANLAPSRRRAEAVAAYLRRSEIDRSRIAIIARGERDLIEETPDRTASALSRVAQIIEQVPAEEMARRRTAWSAFPDLHC